MLAEKKCLEVLSDNFCDLPIYTRKNYFLTPFGVGNNNSGFTCLILYLEACSLRVFIEAILHINLLNQGFCY